MSKPADTPRKLMDLSKVDSLGWSSKVTLEDGVRRVYGWFLDSKVIQTAAEDG